MILGVAMLARTLYPVMPVRLFEPYIFVPYMSPNYALSNRAPFMKLG